MVTKGKKGSPLYDLLMRLSGLDRIHLEAEVQRLSETLGIDPEKMSMSDLRRVALHYLEEMNEQFTRLNPLPHRSRFLRTELVIEEEDLAEA